MSSYSTPLLSAQTRNTYQGTMPLLAQEPSLNSILYNRVYNSPAYEEQQALLQEPHMGAEQVMIIEGSCKTSLPSSP